MRLELPVAARRLSYPTSEMQAQVPTDHEQVSRGRVFAGRGAAIAEPILQNCNLFRAPPEHPSSEQASDVCAFGFITELLLSACLFARGSGRISTEEIASTEEIQRAATYLCGLALRLLSIWLYNPNTGSSSSSSLYLLLLLLDALVCPLVECTLFFSLSVRLASICCSARARAPASSRRRALVVLIVARPNLKNRSIAV